MNQNAHERARQWITEAALGGLGSDEAVWLGEHLNSCPQCTAWAGLVGRSTAMLRMTAEMPDPGLVRATERSARLYARRLEEREARNRWLMASCAMAALWGALLQPYLWRLFGWLGAATDLPDPVWQTAFVWMWVLPGIVGALLLVGRRWQPDWKGAADDDI